MNNRRVVITGMGLVSPLGNKVEDFWNALVEGESGINQLTKLPAGNYKGNTLAAEVSISGSKSEQDFAEYSHTVQYAIQAANQCLDDGGFTEPIRKTNKYGLIIGTTSGNQDILERTLDTFNINSPEDNFNNEASRMLAHMRPIELCSTVSRVFNLGGPSMVIPTACAAGNYALGTAYTMIKEGRSPLMIAGGCDSFSRSCYTIFYRLGGMTQVDCRPFDKDRTGMVVGEGAGMLMLEDLEHAKARGAKIYCEIKGYSLSCDAYHRVAPDPEGKGASAAISKALEASGVAASDIDLISAHGTGTPANDSQEANALTQVFGERLADVPISCLKSMLGHCMGAASAMEAIASVLSINKQKIPPTMNTDEIDPNFPIAIDVNKQTARTAKVENVLSNAFGFGGNICSIILSKYSEK